MIFALGSVNADFEMRVDSPVGASSSVRASDLLRTSGGKAANVAYLGKRLGANATLLSCVGTDDLASQALGRVTRAGVNTHEVGRSGTTNLSMIMVPPDGVKSIVLHEGVDQNWQLCLGRWSALLADHCSGSVLSVDLEAPTDVVLDLARSARSLDVPVLLDPAPPSRMVDELYDLAAAIFPDYEEAAALTNIDTASDDGALRAAVELHKRGVDVACVKLKQGGCAFATADVQTVVHLGALKPPQVDLTGAGDAFAGAFTWSTHNDDDALTAVTYGVAAAALAGSAYGSQESYPTLDELQQAAAQVRG